MPATVRASRLRVMDTRVLIVGGGVAGLATARALRRHAVRADVVERAGAPSRAGAGVYLPANAVRAIGELGLAEELAAGGQRITYQASSTAAAGRSSRSTWRTSGGRPDRAWHLVTPSCTSCSVRGLPVSEGRTVTALHEGAAGVEATFDDGSTDSYDVVVGADGVRSWVRSAYLSGERPRFLDQVSWRFVAVDAPEVPGWTVWLGRRATFLAVPLGRRRTYCFAAVDRVRRPSRPRPSRRDCSRCSGGSPSRSPL